MRALFVEKNEESVLGALLLLYGNILYLHSYQLPYHKNNKFAFKNQYVVSVLEKDWKERKWKKHLGKQVNNSWNDHCNEKISRHSAQFLVNKKMPKMLVLTPEL